MLCYIIAKKIICSFVFWFREGVGSIVLDSGEPRMPYTWNKCCLCGTVIL